jgi:hypothetical protein
MEPRTEKIHPFRIYAIILGITAILILVFGFKVLPCSITILGFTFNFPNCNGPTTDPMAGVWTVEPGNGNSSLKVIITIFQGCTTNRVCGTINLPELPCQASIYLRKIEGNHYDYDATDLQGICTTPAEREYLELRPDGSLEYYVEGVGSRYLRRK